MKSRIPVLMSTIILFAALAVPVWPAAHGQHQIADTASADTGTTNPAPLINQPLVPDAAKPGGAGFTLTVNGTGFVSGAAVDWNGERARDHLCQQLAIDGQRASLRHRHGEHSLDYGR